MGVEGLAQGPLSCRQADRTIPSALCIFTDPQFYFPETQGLWRPRIGNTTDLVYNIYKRPAFPPLWQSGSWVFDSQGQDTLGLASLLPVVECKLWPRLEVWESQPPQDW